MTTPSAGTMMLITSEWNGNKSFRLIPMSNDAPFVEGIYDPTTGDLALISKNAKDSFHMMPKLDDNGDYLSIKGKSRPNGKTFKEERKSFPTYLEYYITKEEEVKQIVETLAYNAGSFGYTSYLKVQQPETTAKA